MYTIAGTRTIHGNSTLSTVQNNILITLKNRSNPAVVLGMFETGLAVGQSLGRAGIPVAGFDFTKKVGFFSRYITASICPNPIENEREFIAHLIRFAAEQKLRPVLFVTSDEFLLAVSRNMRELDQYYLMNLPHPDIVECIVDKYKQYKLALDAGIPVPKTFIVNDMDQLIEIKDQIPLPAFIKGAEVTSWRKIMGSAVKGFVVNTQGDLVNRFREIFERGAGGLVQEIIPGPDTSHFKSSCYVSRKGEILLNFGLQKIRQHPVGFGFGCLVQSVEYPELLALGRALFMKIGYRGVGSAEFKMDKRDGNLKLIEINPRYWQQNALPDRCGMNFPLTDYLEVTNQTPKPVSDYRYGIKWLNVYADFDSFREYRRRKQLTTVRWLQSLKGEKIFSDLVRDDPLPGLRELMLENVIRRSARYVGKRLRDRSGDRRRN